MVLGQFPVSPAVSMGQCNTCSESSYSSLRVWFRSQTSNPTKQKLWSGSDWVPPCT